MHFYNKYNANVILNKWHIKEYLTFQIYQCDFAMQSHSHLHNCFTHKLYTADIISDISVKPCLGLLDSLSIIHFKV